MRTSRNVTIKLIYIASTLLVALTMAGCATKTNSLFGLTGPASGTQLTSEEVTVQPLQTEGIAVLAACTGEVEGIEPVGVLAHGEH